MAKTIALINQKGGVGKTTTAFALAAGLQRAGKRVLLIDADSQASLTVMLGVEDTDALSYTLPDALDLVVADAEISPSTGLLQHVEGMRLLPASIALAATEQKLFQVMQRETILKTLLAAYQEDYDYIIIDCLPSLGLLAVNVLTAADSVIVPVQTQFLSVRGLEQLFSSIGLVRSKLNPRLNLDGILFTMVEPQTRDHRETEQAIRDAYGNAVHIFDTQIPKAVSVREASRSGHSLFEFAPQSPATQAYGAFVKEVLSL